MIMYQLDKDKATALECIFIFYYFRKLIIVDCTQLKQLVSIFWAGVKGVHVTNNIQSRDSSSSRYGSQNSKMQLTLIIAVTVLNLSQTCNSSRQQCSTLQTYFKAQQKLQKFLIYIILYNRYWLFLISSIVQKQNIKFVYK
ncbi:Hypothetical_protein [Hexamita inflata]|uniref:Hypothetical_protein n=1 Tax=Hexamita inflata TaxID=28002 RepID=A0AA86V1L0_9EUKA|nr:Hypothetical protein HINF_LOCUS60317 [Hexamita inflata]